MNIPEYGDLPIYQVCLNVPAEHIYNGKILEVRLDPICMNRLETYLEDVGRSPVCSSLLPPGGSLITIPFRFASECEATLFKIAFAEWVVRP